MRTITCLVLACMLSPLVFTVQANEVPEQQQGIPNYEGELAAESAILLDTLTGEVLFELNADKQMQPASLTKIMTMLLVMEALDSGDLALEDVMITSPRAKEMGGTQVFLDAGDEITVEQAMIAMCVESANDAAVVVAEHMGGSVEGFVEMMNRRATELGMTNTNFVNPTGLPEEGKNCVTSAADVATMSRQLLRYPQITQWTTIPWNTQFMGKVYIANKNLKFIRNYPGGDGLKTGWTEDAGYCLSATAERDGTRLVSVVMDTPTYELRTQDAINLLNYGFGHWRSQSLYGKDEILASVRVDKGVSSSVPVMPATDVAVLLEKSETQNAHGAINLPKFIPAPIAQGSVVGSLDVMLGDEVIDKVDLIAGSDIERANWFKLLGRTVQGFLDALN